MATLIKGHVNPASVTRYSRLGYRRNPFPVQGEVSRDVYVPRPELASLEADLLAFLGGRDQGAVWAIQGTAGLGKSNWLYYVERDLLEAAVAGEVVRTGFRLVPRMSLTPQSVVQAVLGAIGHERIVATLKKRPALHERLHGTELGHFWESLLGKSDGDIEVASLFLARWLAGQQTYKVERDTYGILGRERVPPAVAFPYLLGLVEALQKAGQLDKLVLFLDEFEDVQSLKRSSQTEYVMVLKTLLNTFNWKGLYVVLSGQPSAFEEIGTKYPSLASRWRTVTLLPVRSSKEAVALCSAYKEASFMRSGKKEVAPFPSDQDAQAAFIELSNRGVVTQRALLNHLHELVETRAAK
jgi:hypothetical protein